MKRNFYINTTKPPLQHYHHHTPASRMVKMKKYDAEVATAEEARPRL